MPNIGDFRFPRYGFDEALENIETLVKDLNGEINNKENFAKAIGHKNATSGAYRKKVADLKKFGLMDNNSQATELARNLIHPRSDKHRRNAKFEALMNVELLSKLYDYTGGEPTDEGFWIKLSEVADTKPGEAKKHADKVAELYNSMLEYEPEDENSENADKSEAAESKSSTVRENKSIVPEDVKLRLIDANGNKFDVREEKDLPVAKAFFESRLSEIKEGEEE